MNVYQRQSRDAFVFKLVQYSIISEKVGVFNKEIVNTGRFWKKQICICVDDIHIFIVWWMLCRKRPAFSRFGRENGWNGLGDRKSIVKKADGSGSGEAGFW